jgi:methylated-DNA-protein-cysteine methyltransferase-like protein
MTAPARRRPRAAPQPTPSSKYRRIYAVVRRIPRGRVATYGDVARLAGLPRQPRLVGYALHAAPDGARLPWHRVVNAQGRLSLGRGVAGGELPQRFRLEREGVVFDQTGRLALDVYRWKRPPKRPAPRATRRK